MTTDKRIGETTFAMPSEQEVTATHVVHAPRRLVWEVLTDPRHIPQWMLGPDGWTMPLCEADLRPGGEWHVLWRGPDDLDMQMRGEYREVSPIQRLVQTESWGEPWPETLNTMVLYEKGGKTIITSTVLYPSIDAREAALATGRLEGWARNYARLEQYLRALEQGAQEYACS